MNNYGQVQKAEPPAHQKGVIFCSWSQNQRGQHDLVNKRSVTREAEPESGREANLRMQGKRMGCNGDGGMAWRRGAQDTELQG